MHFESLEHGGSGGQEQSLEYADMKEIRVSSRPEMITVSP